MSQDEIGMSFVGAGSQDAAYRLTGDANVCCEWKVTVVHEDQAVESPDVKRARPPSCSS